MGVLSAYLRRKAKICGGKALNATTFYPGAVSIIQRFGSSLNLNVLLHSQVGDGVYAKLPDGRLLFLTVPSPTDEDIRKITLKIARRAHRYLEKRISETDVDVLEEKEPLLAKCYAASIRSLTALGINAGKPLMRMLAPELKREEYRDDRTLMGFNLHASKAIEADDRAGLERILRHMGRPPSSKERLNMAPDGERLVAIIPSPRKNLVRYSGFFAPNAHVCQEIIANRAGVSEKDSDQRIGRPAFAHLMARVFSIDVLECPRCKSRMQLISFVQDPKGAQDILRSLKMTTAPSDICEPSDSVVEYDSNQVLYTDDDL